MKLIKKGQNKPAHKTRVWVTEHIGGKIVKRQLFTIDETSLADIKHLLVRNFDKK